MRGERGEEGVSRDQPGHSNRTHVTLQTDLTGDSGQTRLLNWESGSELPGPPAIINQAG